MRRLAAGGSWVSEPWRTSQQLVHHCLCRHGVSQHGPCKRFGSCVMHHRRVRGQELSSHICCTGRALARMRCIGLFEQQCIPYIPYPLAGSRQAIRPLLLAVVALTAAASVNDAQRTPPQNPNPIPVCGRQALRPRLLVVVALAAAVKAYDVYLDAPLGSGIKLALFAGFLSYKVRHAPAFWHSSWYASPGCSKLRAFSVLGDIYLKSSHDTVCR